MLNKLNDAKLAGTCFKYCTENISVAYNFTFSKRLTLNVQRQCRSLVGKSARILQEIFNKLSIQYIKSIYWYPDF